MNLSPQRPTTADPQAWKAYWQAQDQLWRTEPEINEERQKYLTERRTIVPNIEKGIYPFKDIEQKLTRADVEWLLATHENGRGPVDWSDESQRGRMGLDLRGADLRYLDLSNLPLAAIVGGLSPYDWRKAGTKAREKAAVHLEGADLRQVHLEGAKLRRAHLERTDLYAANFQNADLMMAKLTGAYLIEAHLENAYLRSAQLDSTNLTNAHLDGANLRFCLFNALTNLEEATFGSETSGFAVVADARWENVNLSMIDWKQIKRLGDESRAIESKNKGGQTKQADERLADYEVAVRANRQLANVLQGQGLNEEAAYFAYRAQVLQKSVLWLQMIQSGEMFKNRMQKFGAWLFSWLLDLLAGYGYRPIRSLIAYLIIIFGFMGLYLLNAHFVPPHLRWDEALVLSVSSFHGRGFFSQNITLGDTYARLAAAEAIIGLFIEISFIATFTKRFFGS